MKYMLMICDDESVILSPAGVHALPQIQAWDTEVDTRGIRRGGARLRPGSDATTVRVRDGEVFAARWPFLNANRRPGNHGREPPVHAPGRGKGAQGPWRHPLRPRGRAVRRRRALPALERHAGLKDPRRPASLMHACIVVSLMAGVRPGEARAIGWEEDVDLDGNPPSVAVLRADRAGGDTKIPRSRRAPEFTA